MFNKIVSICLLSLHMASKRLQNTNEPFIENVLEKYANVEGIQILALGSSYWKPPHEVLKSMEELIEETEVQKYGSILGLDSLRHQIRQKFQRRMDMKMEMDVVKTAGANQGFTNIAFALCDDGDTSSKLVCSFIYLKNNHNNHVTYFSH